MSKKVFCFNWQRDVRMDCTAFIRAETEAEAMEMWHSGEWDIADYDESEISEIDDTYPKITVEKDR